MKTVFVKTRKTVSSGGLSPDNKAVESSNGTVFEQVEKVHLIKLRGMRKYKCSKCGAIKMLDPKKWGRANLESWCYCTPATPSLMSPASWDKEIDRIIGRLRSSHN